MRSSKYVKIFTIKSSALRCIYIHVLLCVQERKLNSLEVDCLHIVNVSRENVLLCALNSVLFYSATLFSNQNNVTSSWPYSGFSPLIYFKHKDQFYNGEKELRLNFTESCELGQWMLHVSRSLYFGPQLH